MKNENFTHTDANGKDTDVLLATEPERLSNDESHKQDSTSDKANHGEFRYDYIGAIIKEFREELDLTQKEFCEKTGFRQSQLCLIEKNQYSLTFKQIVHVCSTLGINPIVFTIKYFDKHTICDNRMSLKLDEYEEVVEKTISQIQQKRKDLYNGFINLKN